MIDVVIADHQEVFRIGLAEVLAGQNDVRVVGQPQSPEQLLRTLKKVKPHVLVLSTDFLPVYPKIQRMLKRRKTALLVLAEGNDRAAYYMLWLRAHGIVYRSMDGPVFLDAMRRVARGELFLQDPSSDIRRDKSDVA
jgi:DNA-binding NarL/FixJ family response regulator